MTISKYPIRKASREDHIDRKSWCGIGKSGIQCVAYLRRFAGKFDYLSQYVNDNPNISVIHFQLDNDEVGRGAAAGIIGGFSEKYEIYDEPPEAGFKDVNEQLVAKMERSKKKEERSR